jgi:predicted dehydrogenase
MRQFKLNIIKIKVIDKMSFDAGRVCKCHVWRLWGKVYNGKGKSMKKQNSLQRKSEAISRRNFLVAGSAATASFFIVPRHVFGGAGEIAPSEKVRVASIGAGGMAGHNIRNCAKVANIVALCDVNDKKAKGIYEEFPDVPKFKDFRVMLEKENKNIDAVIIATPDHTHAVATMAAIQMGKHVYTQKPLTHTIYEARKLAEAAKQAKVVTQMGTQCHSGDGIRMLAEWVADGAVGTIREVHCWSDRPCGYWPQGVPRPKDTQPIPPELDWNLWLGPAPERPYHSEYIRHWRGWWDFGAGALGDMGCHILDFPYFALKLGYPTSVNASHAINAEGEVLEEVERETAPIAEIITYEFPARGQMPPVTLHWYDGALKPPFPRDLEPDRKLSPDGIILVGENGSIMCQHTSTPRIIPEGKMKAYKLPAKTLPRIEGGIEAHEADWIRAIKDGKPTSCGFDYAGPITEVVLLGNLAVRCSGQKLLWDGPNMKVTNVPEASQYVQTAYREGWTL